MIIPILEDAKLLNTLAVQKNPFFAEYYAFYSSWWGGITKNPQMMLLPMDDHMVHRGDGVFEAMKTVNRSVYLMEEHLERLFDSIKKISLNVSFDRHHVKDIILETLRVADKPDAFIRVFISRGPGNFSVNPYDSIAPQLYVIITALHSPPQEKYAKGVTLGVSNLPSKPSWLAQVKSCNYLPNALLKKEAVDRGLDFVIGTDLEGMITEGPTENIMIVDQEGILVHPPFENILKGTTLIRVCELARELGMEIKIRPIAREDLQSAREIILTGTTLNLLPAVKFEDYIIGNGCPGDFAKKLNELLKADIESGIRGTAF